MKEKELNPKLTKSELLLGIVASEVGDIIPFLFMGVFAMLLVSFFDAGLSLVVASDASFDNPTIQALYGSNMEEATSRAWVVIFVGVGLCLLMMYRVYMIMEEGNQTIRNILGIDKKYYSRNFGVK